MNVSLWIKFFKRGLRLLSILYFYIDGANQHFFFIPTIPLALKFIIYLNSSATALFYRWRNLRRVGFLSFGKQIVKFFRSHVERHLQFGKILAKAGPQFIQRPQMGKLLTKLSFQGIRVRVEWQRGSEGS